MPGITDTILSQLSGVRKAYPVITYQGIDVSSVFVTSLISLNYRESVKDEQVSDTVDFELADPEGLFRLTYSLKANQTVSIAIVVENWKGPGSGTINKDCGQMYVTSVAMHSDKGKGTTIKFICSSIAATTTFRLEKKTHAWAQTTVSGVVAQIASDNGWTPKYTASKDPKMDRVDQHDHSDAYMLKKICSENDLTCKVVNNTLWVQSNETIEAQSPIGTIVCPSPTNIGGLDGSGLLSWEYRENTEDCSYASCQVDVKDHSTGKTVQAKTVNPSSTSGGSSGGGPVLIQHGDIHPGTSQLQEGISVLGSGD